MGEGQDRGNSGVFLMDIYEVQVLDSYQQQDLRGRAWRAPSTASTRRSSTPAAGRVSGRPTTSSSTRPRFDASGGLVRPAYLTVFHNGILVQDNEELTGPTAHKARPPYKAHADKLPISLQDHAHPVRFRNIWIRELAR